MNYTLVKDGRGYYRCDPIPSQDELDRLYSTFYSEEKPDYIKNQEADLRWWNAMYDDRITVMSEVYRKSSRKIWPLMLDIGCGGGFFLRRAFANNIHQWMCVGVEPNPVALEYARNASRHNGGSIFYEDSLDKVKEHRFWGIHISEVLEHLIDPLQILKDAYDRLNVGGVICVVVPNEMNELQEGIRRWGSHEVKLDGKPYYVHLPLKPWWFQPPQHINYFDFDSIEALMKEAGFEIYERSAMYPMELFLTQGLDYVNNPTLGRICHQHRKNFDLSMTPEERREFYKEVAKNKLGRECVIFGQKL